MAGRVRTLLVGANPERLFQAKGLPEMAGALPQAAALTSKLQLRFQVRRRLGTIYRALQEKDKARAVWRRLARDDMAPAVTVEDRLCIGCMLQQVDAYESSLILLQQASQPADTEPLRAESRFWMGDTQQLRGTRRGTLLLSLMDKLNILIYKRCACGYGEK